MNNIKFKTHNDDIPFIGGCFQDYLDASYKELKKLFGKPTEGDGYKVDAEWEVLFDNGAYATIYNYKDGRNYLGKEGIPKANIRDWHIGGLNKDAIPIIESMLKELRERTKILEDE